MPERSAPIPVHPRVCGERQGFLRQPQSASGSSPRVRGTPGRGYHPRSGDRFIPACAGNASLGGAPSASLSVHPRVCGERSRWTNGKPFCAGSSPRVRGTPAGTGHACRQARFIPACAGNAVLCAHSSPVRTVHPRVCGERRARHSRNTAPRGSSPRVRGTLKLIGVQMARSRFIPACAGNAPDGDACARRRPVHPRVCGER